MALSDLWARSKQELSTKQVHQIIAIAGEGRLRDGSATSTEFRQFLSSVPSDLVARYTRECIAESFADSGATLQDLVNQIGLRLGFDVAYGRYRGVVGQVGFDGLWRSPTGHALIIEVKTTDTYRVDLNTIAGYRQSLIEKGELRETSSSILLIVGRQDTGDLEAQIRGSRHAWDVRLLSIEALIRLMSVKEALEDPAVIRRIHQILVPREFTRLDDIVDILFSTTEDLRQEAESLLPAGDQEEEDESKKFTPVAFNLACVERISAATRKTFVRHTRATFLTSDDTTRLVCAVSREHLRAAQHYYWFAFHPHQRDFAAEASESYVAFGCGTPDRVVLIPFNIFDPWLEDMNVTEQETVSTGMSTSLVTVRRSICCAGAVFLVWM